MGVEAVLVVLLLFTATVKSQGDVSFSRMTVTLTCPGNGKWIDKIGEIKDSEGQAIDNKEYKFKYNGKATYSCKYKEDGDAAETEYQFYVEGKTCEMCVELDPTIFAAVIAVDVIGTTIVMMIIYRCTKKKSSAGPASSSKTPGGRAPGGRASGGRAPPVPSPDYEALNPQTVSHGTYSVVNRTG